MGGTVNRTTANSTGVSIMHTQSFDELPFIKKKKKK
jgi:hypothetical protein